MSDYWQAVSRAALGLPGSAQLRPRSIFESEEVAAAIEARDEEVDSEPAGAPARLSELVPPRAAPEPAESRRPSEPAPPQDVLAQAAVPAQRERRIEIETIHTQAAPPRDEPLAGALAAPAPEEAPRREPVPPVEAPAMPAPAGPAHLAPEIADRTAAPGPERAPAESQLIVRSEPPAPQPDDARVVAQVIERAAVRAEPRIAPSAPESEPLVIEIGRIDIRIASETPPPAVATRPRGSSAALSLDDYLAQRSRAGR